MDKHPANMVKLHLSGWGNSRRCVHRWEILIWPPVWISSRPTPSSRNASASSVRFVRNLQPDCAPGTRPLPLLPPFPSEEEDRFSISFSFFCLHRFTPLRQNQVGRLCLQSREFSPGDEGRFFTNKSCLDSFVLFLIPFYVNFPLRLHGHFSSCCNIINEALVRAA